MRQLGALRETPMMCGSARHAQGKEKCFQCMDHHLASSCNVAQAVLCLRPLPVQVSLLQQAEDRAHRKGQAHDCVNVYFLCAKGTCDDRR